MGNVGEWGMWSQGGHADRAFCKKSPVGLSVLGRLGYRLKGDACARDPNSGIPPPSAYMGPPSRRHDAKEKRLSFDRSSKEKR